MPLAVVMTQATRSPHINRRETSPRSRLILISRWHNTWRRPPPWIIRASLWRPHGEETWLFLVHGLYDWYDEVPWTWMGVFTSKTPKLAKTQLIINYFPSAYSVLFLPRVRDTTDMLRCWSRSPTAPATNLRRFLRWVLRGARCDSTMLRTTLMRLPSLSRVNLEPRLGSIFSGWYRHHHQLHMSHIHPHHRHQLCDHSRPHFFDNIFNIHRQYHRYCVLRIPTHLDHIIIIIFIIITTTTTSCFIIATA